MRHDPGLDANPPVRYILEVERSGYSPFHFPRPLWTDNLLAKRRRAAYGGTVSPRESPMGLRMQPRSEKFFTLISKAGPNVVESAASLTEFVAALHERWAERVVSMYGLVTVFNFCGLTLSTAFDAPKILRRELLPYERFKIKKLWA